MAQTVTIFFIIALLGSFVKDKKYNALIAGLLLVVMGLMCAFRANNVGVDTPTYLLIYDSSSAIERYAKEFLFFIITKWFYVNYREPQWCQVLMTVITYVPLIWIAVKKSKNACLVVLILMIGVNAYFYETFNIVRQAAATSLLLCAYIWLSESNYKFAVAALVCATGMHSSTIIYLPFIALAWKIEFSPKFVYIAIGVSLIFGFIFSSVSLISNMIAQFASYSIGGTDKYAKFISYRLNMSKNLNGLITLLLPYSGLCIYAYRYFKKNVIMRIFFLGCVMLNVLSIMPTSYRMAYGMTCIEVLIYPMIYSSKIKHKWIPTCIIIIMTIFWFWKMNSVLHSSELDTYNSFIK